MIVSISVIRRKRTWQLNPDNLNSKESFRISQSLLVSANCSVSEVSEETNDLIINRRVDTCSGQ